MLTLAADIAARQQAAEASPHAAPFTEHRDPAFASQLRAAKIERDGKQFHQLEGVASVAEVWYDMWDMFGPYQEKIAAGAFDRTLAADPDVAFLLNHRGTTMARTHKSRTLELWVDETGSLATRAFLNPDRQDVRDLVTAIDDGDVDQMSFAFRILDGHWNPTYDAYVIDEVDINRGDVSAVNFGANPHTSIAARAKLAYLERATTLPAASRAEAFRAAAPAARRMSLAEASLRLSLAD